MANLLDYLDWRGDLTLAQAPFNEVDNLILAEVSFVDFGGIVPPPGMGESVPLRTAAEAFFARFSQGEKIDMGVLVPDAIPEMLRKMAESRRFGDMGLNCFVDWLDAERGEQFAALAVETGDGRVYLSFRGTDDTLAGWKEDFDLSWLPEVPAQKKAAQYTAEVARQYPRRRLLLGGHSKGGNLAVYAGVYCPAAVQRRIDTVWSNDGPGFRDDFLDLPQHRRLGDRIVSIVPKSSVVGMLLEHEEDYTVVDSDQLGFLQHDGFSWQVMGDHFLTLRQVTRQAHLSDLELRAWVRTMTPEQRGKFVEAMFTVLSASGAATLTDLKADSFKAVGAMVRAMKDLDKETRDGLLKFMGLLFRSNLLLTLEGIQEESGKRGFRWGRKRHRPEEEEA
ncbi:Mbeg1-like protein [Dysosmobacter sp.]|uniref:Mbeg1-like protein n=1 Tax=Dysosmobacter sp. TaxID=2591382 RepID=UPI003AB7F7DA